MAINLNNLSPEELINIINSSDTEKLGLSEENRQLTTALIALNSKITQFLEQNATLHKKVTNLIAVSQPKSPSTQKIQQSNKCKKRINEFFPLVAGNKRAKLTATSTKLTTQNTNETTSSNETAKSPTSKNSSRILVRTIL